MSPEIIAQHVAALMTHLAYVNDEGIKPLFEDRVVELLSSQYKVEVPPPLVGRAFEILLDTGIGEVLKSPLTGRMINVSYNRGDIFFGDEPDFSGLGLDKRDEVLEARSLAQKRYPILRTYYSSASEWIERIAERLSNIDLAGIAYSTNEKGGNVRDASNVYLSAKAADQLSHKLAEAANKLETLNLSQADKSQARALLLAAKNLSEAPDPPAGLIWTLLERANSIAGIASLLVSIFALFVS